MIPTAYHLGRRGEVAGGMTQVINDYLTWDFPRYSQALITTRSHSRAGSLTLFARAWRSITSLDRHVQPVIVAHLSQGGSFVREGALAVHARRRGLAVVAQLHGSSFADFSRRHPRLTKWVLRHAHVVHVLSDETAEAVRRAGIRAEIVLIPNAVTAATMSTRSNTVVFGGAVTKRKGVDTLLAAWGSLPADHGWSLTVAGPQYEPGTLGPIPAHVDLVGQLPRDELRQLLGSTKIAVLPSTDEAMPLFILEALASENAVVATPVGGIATVIEHDHSGLIVPVGDVAQLRTALHQLMIDDALRVSLAANGRRVWEERFSAQAVIPQLEALWDRARAHAASGS